MPENIKVDGQKPRDIVILQIHTKQEVKLMNIFNTLKDAYDRYILMDRRISELEKRIEILESTTKSTENSIFTCKKCGIGTYRITDTPRIFCGVTVGKQWCCDNPVCGHVADELQSQKLSS